MRVLLRTAGGRARNREIGLGHVYRCINLASKLKSHDLYFLIEDYGGVEKILIKHGYHNIIFFKKDIDVESDIKKTLSFVNEKKIDFLIVDKYGIKINYIRKVKKIVRTILITDLRNIDFPADLIINGFIGFKNTIKKNKYGTKCLLGPKYQILNDCFAKKKHVRKKYDLLATFGGLDDHQVIEGFLEVLSKYSDKIRTKLILGPVTIKSKKIRQLEAKSHTNLKIIQQTNNMQKEMSQTKFGICSGGITSYEFAALNIPFAIISQVEHQLLTASEWKHCGVALDLGLIDYKTQYKINRFLMQIVENNVSIMKPRNRIVDGLGSHRAAVEILKMNYKKC